MNLETYNQSNDGNNFNFTNPQDFQIKINVLNQQLPPLLDDFKPAYVNYNTMPEYASYENNFNNIRDNIININADLFTITNDIEMSIQQISADLQNKDQEIQSEKQQNADLKSQQQNSDYKNNGSYQMINDYKELYNLKNINNYSIFFGIVIAIFITKTIFSANKKILTK